MPLDPIAKLILGNVKPTMTPEAHKLLEARKRRAKHVVPRSQAELEAEFQAALAEAAKYKGIHEAAAIGRGDGG